MVQSVSVYSDEEVDNIIKDWSTKNDTCTETPEDDPKFYQLIDVSKPGGVPYHIVNTRPLKVRQAEQAMGLIRACVQRYPFNIRYELGAPMWLRFCEEWDNTGDMSLALRAI